jgi:hypothetical protein
MDLRIQALATAGKHTIKLRLLVEGLNMDGTINRARIQSVQLERID